MKTTLKPALKVNYFYIFIQSKIAIEMESKQMQQYKMVLEVFKEYKEKVASVTFWNGSDKSSRLDNFPVRGHKNYPLLFDQNLQPKKAYWEVVRF